MEDIYLDFAERLGHRSEGLARIIEYAASPRQARILMEMNPSPGPALTAEELGEKLNLDPRVVQDDVEDLFRKGLAFPRDFTDRREWRSARNVFQIHDSMQCGWAAYPDSRRLHDLWRRYEEEERYATIAREHAQRDKPVMRIIPAWRSVMDDPNLQPWEDWREILNGMPVLSVVDCSCRLEVGACGRPTNVCIDFGRAAQYDIASGHGRQISSEEAILIMDEAATSGLIGMASPNSRQMATICNCCSDCCVDLVPLTTYGVPFSKAWEKSRYEARIDQEQCSGCQRCLDNCNFDAIEMVSVTGTKKLKAQVDPEKCFGCGACYMVCEPLAIAMVCVRPESHVPE